MPGGCNAHRPIHFVPVCTLSWCKQTQKWYNADWREPLKSVAIHAKPIRHKAWVHLRRQHTPRVAGEVMIAGDAALAGDVLERFAGDAGFLEGDNSVDVDRDKGVRVLPEGDRPTPTKPATMPQAPHVYKRKRIKKTHAPSQVYRLHAQKHGIKSIRITQFVRFSSARARQLYVSRTEGSTNKTS